MAYSAAQSDPSRFYLDHAIYPDLASPPYSPNLDGDRVAMSTTTEFQTEQLSDTQGSPAPSNAGSTGTSGITVRNGPQGQPLSFRR